MVSYTHLKNFSTDKPMFPVKNPVFSPVFFRRRKLWRIFFEFLLVKSPLCRYITRYVFMDGIHNNRSNRIMIRILAGTSNKHKVQEFRSAFAAFEDRIALLALDDLPPFSMPEEIGNTFEENARIKADGVSAASSLLSFADDSGLEVECLGNAPGIYSARYAGENATDADRIAKLLSEMKKSSSPNRKARFVCVMALSYRGKTVKVFRGEVSGVICEKPSGSHGFGYDPVFIPDGYEVSFGELPAEVKDSISHRAKALEKLSAFLKQQLSKEDFFDFV